MTKLNQSSGIEYRVKDIVTARATLNPSKTSTMTTTTLRANKYTGVSTCKSTTSINTN